MLNIGWFQSKIRWNKVLRGFRFALTLGLLSLCLRTGWGIVGLLRDNDANLPIPSSTSAPAVAPPHENALTLADKIASKHLFGIAPAPASDPSPARQPAVAAQPGDAQLTGIFFGTDGKTSRAIISVRDIERAYAVGQHLPDGARLAAIKADKISLLYGKMPVTLTLKRHESDIAETAMRITAEPANREKNAPAPVAHSSVSTQPALTRLLQLRRKVLAGR